MVLYRIAVFSAYIIFLCNMAISYYHALELFQDMIGFPGLFAHVAVVGVDTLFAVSTLVISNAITRQIRVGFPVWLGFIVGFAFTEWSNVRACWDDGIEGIIAGSAPVFALLCIKFLLSWMVANKEAFASSHTHNARESHNVSLTHRSNSHSHEDSHTLSHSESHRDSHTHTQDESHIDSHTQDSHEFSHTQSRETSHTQSREDSHTDSHTLSHALSQSHTHEDSCVRESHSNSHPRNESHNVSESHEDSHTHDSHNKESHEESHTQPSDPREVAREIARDYYKKHKKLPTIRGLMTEAGCKEWDARVARNEVKKEFGVVEDKKTRKKRVAQ